MTKLPTKDPIPHDVSRKELAQFWDTHSFAAYRDELKPVQVRVAKNLSAGVTIRFTQGTLHQLRSRAYEQGIGPATLIRMWVLEKLRSVSKPPPSFSSR